jgi:chemotaxis receptor (MCP) glutamine deamidase CheD
MFATGLDIGSRNAVAVIDGLRRAGIVVALDDTGGSHGRTVRVTTSGRISSQTAGGAPRVLDGPDLTKVAA